MAEPTRGMNRIGTNLPSGSPIDRIMSTADQATARRQALDAIRRLHSRRPLLIRGTTVETWQCGHCETEYPCPTIALLDRHGI